MDPRVQKLMRSWRPTSLLLRSVGRLILLAAAVGVFAGLAAAAFQVLCQVVIYLALDSVAGYSQGFPRNEEVMIEEKARDLVPWLLLIVPTLGGLLVGWLTFKLAPEASGGGADQAIDAYHNRRGVIRKRVPWVKMLATAISVGTGGSGGREGPIGQIGAGCGSYLATRLRLSDPERRVLMAAGLGAGIGALFHAPLAGAIFAIEVLYRDPEFESEAMIPAFLATTIAYCVFNVVTSIAFGAAPYLPLFAVAEGMQFRNPLALIPLTFLALTVVAASYVFARTYQWTSWSFRRLSLRPWLKPGLGGMLTGVVALLLYGVIGMLVHDDAAATAQHDVLSVLSFGYGFLQKIIHASDGSGLLIVVLLAVAFGKMITTSLTIGSGGSAGLFGPTMVIGGCLGAVVGLLFQAIMPGAAARVDVFVLVGMVSFYAAAANTPVSSLIMVTELTGSYELLLPTMWVCALAYLLSRGWTLYPAQVGTRVDSPAHRGDFLIDVLQGLTVRDAIDTSGRRFVTVLPGMLLRDVVLLFADTQQTCFPVIDRNGKYFGLFGLNDVRQFLYDSDVGELAVALDLATMAEPLRPDMDLNTAIERFADTTFEELPVIDPEQADKITGLLRRQDLIAAYNTKLLELRTATRDEG